MRREAAHAIIAAKRKWTENNGGIIMEFIREERQTPIKDRCRVLVAGGGYASVSAALAAARGGADVLKRRERGESCVPVTMATIPELRMTRRLVGETDVCARDDHRRCERSVGMFSDWTKRGPVYELPFGALYHPSVPNLLTAGRCLSAADDLWNVTRVIPVCAVSGEAAGTAASLGCDFPALDIAALQETLRAQGVRVHLDEL